MASRMGRRPVRQPRCGSLVWPESGGVHAGEMGASGDRPHVLACAKFPFAIAVGALGTGVVGPGSSTVGMPTSLRIDHDGAVRGGRQRGLGDDHTGHGRIRIVGSGSATATASTPRATGVASISAKRPGSSSSAPAGERRSEGVVCG